jgi:uncharacterized protein YdaU (DUF1376 family)
MYPSDFEAKTSHLTIAEDGAYNRLLRICWMTPGCTMPADEAWIMRRARAHTDEDKEIIRLMLSEFFDLSDGRYSNAKQMQIFAETNAAHERRKNAGSKGGKAKALKTKKTEPSNAVALTKQPEPEPELLVKRDTKVSPKKGTRLPDDWFLPVSWGEWGIGEGWTHEALRVEADTFKDYWHSVSGAKGVKLDWLATWRNWLRNSKNKPNGAINGKPTGQTETRLSRVIAAAAEGSSRSDWG